MDEGRRSKRSLEYVDFELEIRKGSLGEYSVRVLRSPAGEPQAMMHLPFPKGEMESKLEELEENLYSGDEETRSSKTRRDTRSPEKRVVQDFGQSLFWALLEDREMFACYRGSLEKASQQRKGLRLKLRVEPPELARLPWEFLYDSGRQEYVCESRNRTLVRYLEINRPVEELRVEPPLKILGMVASPLDLELLDVEREKRRVEKNLKTLQDGGLVELKWVEGETYEDLEREMRDGPWHVFHFIGHGDFDSHSEEGGIALADETRRTDLLKAEDLATLLVDHYDLKLVFLNSCEGARSSEGDAFSSSAAILVRRGVPAVVAMQYEITDGAAIAFSQAFYGEVARGSPVDSAVALGRISVKRSSSSTLEWGTPVLYMRSPDGRIFDVQGMGAKKPRGGSQTPGPIEWLKDRIKWLKDQRRPLFIVAWMLVAAALVLGAIVVANWYRSDPGQAQAAAGEYYRKVEAKEWGYTYENLASETQRKFTRDEWERRNGFFAKDDTDYDVLSAKRVVSLQPFRPKVEVLLYLNYANPELTDEERITYFVYEDGGWKHAFSKEENDRFMPDASYEDFKDRYTQETATSNPLMEAVG